MPHFLGELASWLACGLICENMASGHRKSAVRHPAGVGYLANCPLTIKGSVLKV